jgi:hypothetical protein
MRVIKYTGWSFAWLIALVCATWAIGALYFDFPTASMLAAILFVVVLLDSRSRKTVEACERVDPVAC